MDFRKLDGIVEDFVKLHNAVGSPNSNIRDVYNSITPQKQNVNYGKIYE